MNDVVMSVVSQVLGDKREREAVPLNRPNYQKLNEEKRLRVYDLKLTEEKVRKEPILAEKNMPRLTRTAIQGQMRKNTNLSAGCIGSVEEVSCMALLPKLADYLEKHEELAVESRMIGRYLCVTGEQRAVEQVLKAL